MPENEDDSYDPFYLGYARVVQSDRHDFLAVGPNGGRLRVSRGQVHLDSELDGDLCDVGSEGHLTVTRWWAQSRKLKEAPPPPPSSATSPGQLPDRPPTHRSFPPKKPRSRGANDTPREGPAAPEGFTSRSSDSGRHSRSFTPDRSRSATTSENDSDAPSDAPDGFTRRTS